MLRKPKSTLTWLLGTMFSVILLVGATGVENANQVMIKFNAQANVQEVDSLVSTLGLSKVNSLEDIKVEVFEVSSDYSVQDVVQICSNVSFIEYVEPSALARLRSAPPEASPAPATAVQAEVAEYVTGEVIVKFKKDVGSTTISSVISNVGFHIAERYDKIGVLKCDISGSGRDVLQAVEECNADPNVEYAEPNYIYYASVVPNDPRYSSLYAMDIMDAPAAWDKQTGSSNIIVGVIDTGVDLDHEDLQANIWQNPGETPGNGVDDDGNGFVDDVNGWDFKNNDSNPNDDNDHGTHVSGTIGAEGNNGTGVAGVNWNVSIMALKFLGGDGSGTTGDAVEAIIYGTDNGAKVLNNSWGGGGRSQALEDAIKYARDNGVIFVAAAGNNFSNNDSFPTYPANYEVENVIAVAASNSSDNAGFSNFGRHTVDLAAPGSAIVSTVRNDLYRSFDGTSMATPHVAGACALVWAQFPSLNMNRVMIRVLGSVERNTNFADKVRTGGRLNLNRALSTNPIIANTTRLENTLDETGPYEVESDILDDGSIQNATLTYQVVGQSPVTVNMTNIGASHYKGEIPGQTLGSTITYFVKATDNENNMTQDSNFTFSIAEPTGGGCCGEPAIDIALGHGGMKTAVNALANISFFILPVVIYGVRSRRRKK